MKRIALFCVGMALTGCATSNSEEVIGPSGKPVREAKCSGSATACFKSAASSCKGSYQVIDSSSNAGGLLADVIPGPVTWYRMTYQCGPSDGRMPSFAFRGQSYTPPPVVISQPKIVTTNCSRLGNSVNCTSY